MKMRKSVMIVAGVAGILAVSATAFATNGTWSSNGDRAAGEVVGLADATAAPISSDEAKQLRTMLATVPITEDRSLGPISEDLPNPESGKVLVDTTDGRIAAAATDRGDVCYVASFNKQVMGGTCVPSLPSSGVALSQVGGFDRHFLLGITATDVDSITVETQDGKSHPAAVKGGAFVWSAAAGESEPETLVVERNGKTERIIASVPTGK